MATQKQRAAAKRNVKKAQSGARKKQTLKNLSKGTRTALGKEANKVRKGKARSGRSSTGRPPDSTSAGARRWARTNCVPRSSGTAARPTSDGPARSALHPGGVVGGPHRLRLRRAALPQERGDRD